MISAMPRLAVLKTSPFVLAVAMALWPPEARAQVIYPTAPVAPVAYPQYAYPQGYAYPPAYGIAPGYGTAVPPGYSVAPGSAYGTRPPFGPTTDTRPGQTGIPTDQSQGAGASAAGGVSYEAMRDPTSNVYQRYGGLNPAAGPIRAQVIARAARGVGIRSGFAEEAARLNAAVAAAYAVQLDARYNFRTVMIGQSLVPPVITEIRQVAERGGARLLYLTLGAFEIVKPARLTLAPPTWRDYLRVYAAEGRSAASILPQDSSEQAAWDTAYTAGVAAGIEEARASFSEAFNRLDRDYAGMVRYHELAAQGAISLPVVNVSAAKVRIAEGGTHAFVGEKVVTLRVTPRFRAARPAAFN